MSHDLNVEKIFRDAIYYGPIQAVLQDGDGFLISARAFSQTTAISWRHKGTCENLDQEMNEPRS